MEPNVTRQDLVNLQSRHWKCQRCPRWQKGKLLATYRAKFGSPFAKLQPLFWKLGSTRRGISSILGEIKKKKKQKHHQGKACRYLSEEIWLERIVPKLGTFRTLIIRTLINAHDLANFNFVVAWTVRASTEPRPSAKNLIKPNATEELT